MSESADRPLIDAAPGNWVDTLAPSSSRPYLRLARLDRPIGWWLLLLPCWWSAALAAIALGRPYPDVWHLALFAVGAVTMRGAGSIFNDIVDRDLDAKVERTRGRPIPSGQVSVRQAELCMAGLAAIGFLVLIQFNWFTVALGISSLFLVALYPFMKRIMPVPQLVLGLAFAWGGLMGWAAATGSLDWPAIAIYGAAIAWTVGYDTIYAVQDIEDDPMAGIYSSARFFGGATRRAVAACYSLAVMLLVIALIGAGSGPVGYIAVAAFGWHLNDQVNRIDPQDAPGALKLFRSNRVAGLILFAGLCAEALASALYAGLSA